MRNARNTRLRLIQALVVVALQLGGIGTASAICQRTTTLGETSAFGVHGCWTDFIKWYARAYQTLAEDWEPNGYSDACNITKEYPKHWNAVFLINHGITFDHGFFGRPFHSVFDYDQVARARESDEWHNDLRHQEVDNLGAGVFSQFRYRTGLFEPADLIQSSCLLFNSTNTVRGPGIDPTGLASDDPAFRAGALVHEGWHAWKRNHNIQNPPESSGHASRGPIVGTSCSASACDFMYFHSVSNYQHGELWIEKGGHAQSHSVFQTHMEFLCDLADQSSLSMPFVTRQVAAQAANWISLNNFLNGPAFACGSAGLVGVPHL